MFLNSNYDSSEAGKVWIGGINYDFIRKYENYYGLTDS